MATRRAAWPVMLSPTIAALNRTVAAALLVLLAMATCVLSVRRVSGALSDPPSTATLVAAGCVLSLATIWFRVAGAAAVFSRPNSVSRYLVWLAPAVISASAAATLSFADGLTGGLVALWGLIAITEGLSWRRRPRNQRVGAAPSRSTHADGQHANRATRLESPGAEVVEAHQLDDQAVSQYLVRRGGDEGGETLEGWVRADFAASQRHAIAHVAICPPFGRTPQCYAEQADGPAGTVKVAQVLPYGVRLEIKLDEPAEEAARVTVEFSIQEQPHAAE